LNLILPIDLATSLVGEIMPLVQRILSFKDKEIINLPTRQVYFIAIFEQSQGTAVDQWNGQ
jgi:hypothetical protein